MVNLDAYYVRQAYNINQLFRIILEKKRTKIGKYNFFINTIILLLKMVTEVQFNLVLCYSTTHFEFM